LAKAGEQAADEEQRGGEEALKVHAIADWATKRQVKVELLTARGYGVGALGQLRGLLRCRRLAACQIKGLRTPLSDENRLLGKLCASMKSRARRIVVAALRRQMRTPVGEI
jgi:hypothetical protein